MLASGVGEQLSTYLRPYVPLLIDMSKDKKVTGAANACLDTFFGNVFSISQILDNEMLPETLNEKKQKNALARCTALSFLLRCFKRGSDAGPLGVIDIESYERAAHLASAKLSDLDPAPRKVATEFLQLLLSNDVDAVVSVAESVIDKLKGSNPRAYKALSASGKEAVSTKSGKERRIPQDTTPAKVKTKPSANTAPTVKKTHNHANDSSKAKSTRVAGTEKTERPEPSIEDVISVLGASGIEKWSDTEDEGGILAGIKSSSWKLKKCAIDNLATFVGSFAESKAEGNLPVGAVLALVKDNTKGLKQSNINLTKSIFDLLLCIFQTLSSLKVSPDMWMCKLVVPVVVEKVSDRKLGSCSYSILDCLCEVMKPEIIISLTIAAITDIKSPLSQEAFLKWTRTLCEDFGAAALGNGLHNLTAWIVKGCSSSNAKIRKAALDAAGEIHKQLGPIFVALAIAPDEKVKLLLDGAYQSCPYDPEYASISRSKSCFLISAHSQNGDDGDSAPALGIDIPKVDLFEKLPNDCVSRMGTKEGKNAWKLRKEAMEEVEGALKKSNGLVSTDSKCLSQLANLMKALRERLTDSQSNLKPFAASVIGLLLSSVEPDGQAKLAKLAFQTLFSAALTDNRKPMRESAISALEKGTERIAVAGGGINSLSVEVMILPFVTILKETEYKAVGTPEALKLLADRAPSLPKVDSLKTTKARDLEQEFARQVVFCLTSSKKDTRAAAEELLVICIEHNVVSEKSVNKVVREMGQAQRRSVSAIVEKIIGNEVVKTEGVSAIPSQTPAKSKNALARRMSLTPRGQSTPRRSTRSNRGGTSSTQDAPISARKIEQGASADTAELEEDTFHPLQGSGEGKSSHPVKGSKKSDNWPEFPEEPTSDSLLLSLKKSWFTFLPHSSQTILFPAGGMRKQDCAIPGVNILSKAVNLARDFPSDNCIFEQLDFILKWVSFALASREHTVGLQSLLKFVKSLFSLLRIRTYQMDDDEIGILIPHLLERGSTAKGRFRAMYQDIISLVTLDPPIVNLQKFGILCCVPVLESSQYSKARVIAMNECRSAIDVAGVHALGKKGLVLVCKCIDETSAEIRNAAVEVISAVLKKMNGDQQRLLKVCGSSISSKGRASLIEHWEKHTFHDHELTHDVTSQPRSAPKSRRSSLLSTTPTVRKTKSPSRKSMNREVPLNLRLGDTSKESLTGLSSSHLSNITTESGPFTFNDPSTNSRNPTVVPAASLQIDVPPRFVRDDGITDISPATSNNSNASGLSSSVHSDAAASLRARLKQIRQKHRSSYADNSSEIASSEIKVRKNVESFSEDKKAMSRAKKTISISDVFNSIDDLLGIDDSVSECNPELSACIESIRELHSCITSASSTEATSSIRTNIEDDLIAPMDRLVRLLEFGFKHGQPNNQAGLLVDLLSVTLAALMAIFRDSKLAAAVTDISLTQLIREASLALLDSRLASASFPSNGIDSTTATHLVRAINKLAIQAAISSHRHVAFKSLMSLQLQFCSGNNYEVGNQRLARVTAKLFARVIKAEETTSNPFSGVDLEYILCSLDDTLVACDEKIGVDMSPCIDLVRSLLTAIVKSQDREKVVVILSDLGIDIDESRLGVLLSGIANCEKIPRNKFQTRGDDATQNPRSSVAEGDASVAVLTKLVSDVSLSVEDKDRKEAVENLRSFVKAHPEIDINVHLAQVSSHFRSYILEQVEVETTANTTNHHNASKLCASAIDSIKLNEVSSPKSSDMAERIAFLKSRLNKGAPETDINEKEPTMHSQPTLVESKPTIIPAKSTSDAAARLRARLEAVKRAGKE